MASIQQGDITDEETLLSALSGQNASCTWIQSLDAILILGGGVPLAPKEPPVYVQRRCDVVAEIMNALKKEGMEKSLPRVLCLSAGTAHLPQYILPNDGLPLWESTSSAAYLINHPKFPVDHKHLFVETTSYDTISNAFYARTGFTDVAGWKKLLVVTNEFHVHRSKAIFDWIFGVVSSEHPSDYELYYLSCNNIGLTSDAIQARKSHELRGEANVRTKLASEYTTLQAVFEFLTTKHDFYTARKLVDRATASAGERVRNQLLEMSYGKDNKSTMSPSFEIKDGKVVVSVPSFIAVACLIGIIGVSLVILQNFKSVKYHSHRN